MSCDKNLEQWGLSGLQLVEREYSWRCIAQKISTLLQGVNENEN